MIPDQRGSSFSMRHTFGCDQIHYICLRTTLCEREIVLTNVYKNYISRL